MSKTLGGSIFCYNAISQDYCLMEAVASLKDICDEIVVLDAGSTDDTPHLVQSFQDEKTRTICLPNKDWAKMRGKEKLSHFANISKSMLSTEWRLDLQADEIIDERSFDAIREAIEQDNEGYFVERINLWGDSQHRLNVEDSRLPVGNKIIRLAKTKYFSVDDSEGIFSPASWDYFSKIRIWHMGFVRNSFTQVKKIKHMLEEVFGMQNDDKVVSMGDKFNPWLNFSKDDVIPIGEPLPKYIEKWARERDEINSFEI